MQEVVQGKSGYLLEVGGERYWVQLQVDLGVGNGVAVASRPDFLLVPVRSNSPRRPIAVFADGWAYHKDCLREDARKRSALVASGLYWVWSVTWEDVEAALAGEIESDFDVQADHARLPSDHPLIVQASLALGVPAQARSENAVAALLRWLASPVTNIEDPGLERMERQAALLSARMVVEPGTPDQVVATTALQDLASVLPDGCHEEPAGAAPALSRVPTAPVTFCYAWPKAFLQKNFDVGFGGVRLSPDMAASADVLKQSWRQWLALYNRVQVLPNTFLLETSGVLHGDYAVLAKSSFVPSSDGALADNIWQEMIDSALEELQPGLGQLRSGGMPAPDHVGFELASASGNVIAEAELAWQDLKVILLAEHQVDLRAPWEAAGWTVIDASVPEWPSLVLERNKE